LPFAALSCRTRGCSRRRQRCRGLQHGRRVMTAGYALPL
jgi:hypothetical protein